MPRQERAANCSAKRETTGGRSRGAAPGTSRNKRAVEQAEPNQSSTTSKPARWQSGRITPGLYLVATPIGHASDVTLRALDVLRTADLIACEDTRVTGRLLAQHGIRTQRTPYHEHNAERARPALLARLRSGAVVALVSDAGTPLISDPGYKLVEACIAEGIAVTAVPGASAVLTALQLSGLPTDRFFFAGFLPTRTTARRRALQDVTTVPGSLVFFESGRRLATSLADMAAVLGDRPAAVTRELTKLFEEVRRDRLSVLAAGYADAPPPKGEIVVVVGPPLAATAPTPVDIDDRLRAALATHSLRDAATLVATETALPRRDIYARALKLAKERKEEVG